MFWRWRETVCGLITSSAAISRFVRPAATSRSTSSSRSVSGDCLGLRNESSDAAVGLGAELFERRAGGLQLDLVALVVAHGTAGPCDVNPGPCGFIRHPERAPPRAGSA